MNLTSILHMYYIKLASLNLQVLFHFLVLIMTQLENVKLTVLHSILTNFCDLFSYFYLISSILAVV
jgi:hypothetical protein